MSFLLPNLCGALGRPIRWIPKLAHSTGLALMLNQVLKELRQAGDMDFLHGKLVQLVIDDIGVSYCVLFDHDGRFKPADGDVAAQVRISGDLGTFLLLATQREDADSLFFRRLLRMQGETATGLHLKNFLDALGDPPLPSGLRYTLERLTDLYTLHCVEGGLKARHDQVQSAQGSY